MGVIESETVVELIRESTRTLFETMMDAIPEPLPVYRISTVRDSHESVFCLIGFSGEMMGSGSLHCSGACARQLASALLMGEYLEVDAEVLDAVAEVTNMIIGNFKTAVEERHGVIGISTPTVIYGEQYAARNFGASDWIVVPFRYHDTEFDLRVSLQPDKARTRRTEQLLNHREALSS
ncbi:MAG: chemotaxis protein CheX [Bryobacterales bacterium]|nr:chemotaxis protein CheX [Bryobacterales bacterium]